MTPISEGVVDASGYVRPEWPMWTLVQLATVVDGSASPRHFVLEHVRVAATQPYPIVLGGDERLLEVEVQDGRGRTLPGARVRLLLPVPERVARPRSRGPSGGGGLERSGPVAPR